MASTIDDGNNAHGNGGSGHSMEEYQHGTMPHIRLRKVMKGNVERWELELRTNHQATCPVTDCNFIGYCLKAIKFHYRTCKSTLVTEDDACRDCGMWLQGTPEGRVAHSSMCSTLRAPTPTPTANIKEKICLFCKEIKETTAELSVHMATCGGSGEVLSPHNVASMLRLMSGRNPFNIIQRPPVRGSEAYYRRRSHNKSHITAWENKLATDKYIRCHFQNCFFMALSLEDMFMHYGLCDGEPTFAPFRCSVCGGGVTTQQLLDTHLEVSHPHFSASNAHEAKEIGESVSQDEIRLVNRTDSESIKGESMDSLLPVNYSKKDCDDNFSESRSSGDIADSQGRGRNTSEHNGTVVNNSESSSYNETSNSFHVNSLEASASTHINVDKTKKKSRLRGKKSLNDVVKNEVVSESTPQGIQVNLENENSSNFDENSVSSGVSQRGRSTRKRPLKAMQYDTDSDEGGRRETKSEACVVDEEFREVQKRKRKIKIHAPVTRESMDPTSCGKCGEDFENGNQYVKHNYRVHNGLGWRIGEDPPDLSQESAVLGLLRDAFKVTKNFRCENCFNVKKSVFGFHSHLQTCGKTEEEKEKLKVTCEVCGKAVKPYSLPMHMRQLHQTPVITATVSDGDDEEPPVVNMEGRRKSAIKCRSKLKKALKDEKSCVFFSKGSAIPVLNDEITKKWMKEINKTKLWICKRQDCNSDSPTLSFALLHFFNCPTLPEAYYQCLVCTYSTTEAIEAKLHEKSHAGEDGSSARAEADDYSASTDDDADGCDDFDDDEDCLPGSQVIVKIEEQEVEEPAEDEAGDSDDNVDPQSLSQSFGSSPNKKWRRGTKPEDLREESRIEHGLRRSWATRENLSSQASATIYRLAFIKEYTRQLEDTTFANDRFPTLHTTLTQWSRLPKTLRVKYMPPLMHSLPVQFCCGDQSSSPQFLETFQAVLFDETWSMFVGGPVLSLAWCPVDIRRFETRQYLAVSVSRYYDQFLNFKEGGEQQGTLLQIWDMGLKGSDAAEMPRLALGVAADYGEALCVTWAPFNTATSENGKCLPRLGLLAGAFEDGGARIFSICDPSVFTGIKGRPFYKVEPVVSLIRHGVLGYDACLRLAWGISGVFVAGYKSGAIAVWNLSTLSVAEGTTAVLQAVRVFKPYNNPVSALALCPVNEKVLLSSAKDRFVTSWDITQPVEPNRILQSALVDRVIWLRNWPVFVFASEDSCLTLDSPLDLRWRKQHTSCVANIRDFTFSDWTFIGCFVNEAGEALLRHWKDPFIEVNKTRTKDNLMLSQLDVRKGEAVGPGEEYMTYDEALEDGAKLVFTELSLRHRDPSKLPKYSDNPCPATFPLRAITQVVFNPNYRNFSNIALGYQCGLLRLIRLKNNSLELNDLFSKYDQALRGIGDNA